MINKNHNHWHHKDQYNVYNDFIFIGAVPIDFDTKLSPGMCVINELCNINIQKLYKKEFNLGNW